MSCHLQATGAKPDHHTIHKNHFQKYQRFVKYEHLYTSRFIQREGNTGAGIQSFTIRARFETRKDAPDSESSLDTINAKLFIWEADLGCILYVPATSLI